MAVVKVPTLRVTGLREDWSRRRHPKVKHSLSSNDLVFGDWPIFYRKRAVAVEGDLGGANPVPVSSNTMPYPSVPSSSVVP